MTLSVFWPFGVLLLRILCSDQHPIFFPFFLLNYKSFHFSPSSQYPPTSPTPSTPPSPALRAVRVSCPVGSSSSSPLPPGPGKVRVQTDWSAKIQYMQRKQVPVSLSMAFQKGSGPATFRESGWITSSFSPSPTGLGELSLYQFPCISGCSHPSQS